MVLESEIAVYPAGSARLGVPVLVKTTHKSLESEGDTFLHVPKTYRVLQHPTRIEITQKGAEENKWGEKVFHKTAETR
jgi:hypothetical protein